MTARLFFAWRLLDEAARQDYRNNITKFRAKSRAAFDPLKDLSEREFKNRYRLSKQAFKFLCDELKSLTSLKSSQRVSLEVKVLTALFFYASGSYQRPVGVAKNLSQKMCSIYIDEVTKALIHPSMLQKYIKFPATPAARLAVSQKFFAKNGIPGVVGCIDGSHFRIFGPPREQEHMFYCRKHYHSINVQMVAGWGLTSEDGRASPVLKVVNLAYVDVVDCLRDSPSDFREYITSDKFCDGYKNGTALCRGDSDGGLVYAELEENGFHRHYLRGIASTAPKNDHECNSNVYTTFTEIVRHAPFISSHYH